MKKLLTLICLSLIVSASVESDNLKTLVCHTQENGVRVCCYPPGECGGAYCCFAVPKPPPSEPIINPY